MLGPDSKAVGIGVPGRVDIRNQTVLSAGFLDVGGLPLAALVAGAVGKPVFIDGDARMALVAERAVGAAVGLDEVVLLTVGTGIGGGSISRGVLHDGRGSAGQLGHVSVEPRGEPCRCGRRGCVETTSSGTALRRHIVAAGLSSDLSIDALFALDEIGDGRAHAVLDRWAAPLRATIDSLVAILDPQLCVSRGWSRHAAWQALQRFPAVSPWYQCPVKPAKLGDDAGVIGAALRALGRPVAAKSWGPRARPKRRFRAVSGGSLKKALLINGVPASGKTMISRRLATELRAPALSLDTIKEALFDTLGTGDGDRDYNRRLGRASFAAIFAAIGDFPDGFIVVVDAWFGSPPRELVIVGLERAGIGQTAEIWCHADPEVLARRYTDRVPQRHPGHPGASYVPELVALAKRAAGVGARP